MITKFPTNFQCMNIKFIFHDFDYDYDYTSYFKCDYDNDYDY